MLKFIALTLISGLILPAHAHEFGRVGNLTTESSGWGTRYEIEDRFEDPVLTRESVERLLDFNFRTNINFQKREIRLIADDNLFDTLVRAGYFHADGRLAARYFTEEFPELDPSVAHTANTLRINQLAGTQVPVHVMLIRKSELQARLRKHGILDHNNHFIKTASFNEVPPENNARESEIIRHIQNFQIRQPKPWSKRPRTQSYVVRKLFYELVYGSVEETPERMNDALRGSLADFGQIWEILAENPSLDQLATGAGLPSGDGRSIVISIAQALLAQPVIKEKLSQFAGEDPDSTPASHFSMQAHKRFELLKLIPDPVVQKLAAMIREKIRTADLSGVDAIKGITSLNTGGEANELATLMQKTLGHYFRRLSYADKSRLALAYLELEPEAPVEQQIAAALQATGPFVQKLFQLIGDEVNSDVLKRASAALKASVKPFPAEVSRAIVERDLGGKIEDIFSEFDDHPVSAGTVGQIHLAKLRSTGEEVVVKVLRPGVRAHFLREVALIKEAITDPAHRMIVDAYAETILREMDLRNEAENTDAAAFMDRPAQGVSTVKRIQDLPVTENVLVLSRAPGKALDRIALFQGVPKAGELEKLTGKQVAEMLAKFSNMVRIWFGNALFGDGGFHGDFHTGNAMMHSTAERPQALATVIDLGNFQRLTVDQRQRFLLLLVTSFKSDSASTASLVAALADMTSQQQEALRKRLDAAQWSSIDMNLRLGAALGYATQMGARLPPEFLNFARSKQMLETAIKIVNKNLDSIDPARKIYKRLNPLMLFGRGALEEIKQSFVDPNHPGRGDQRVLTAAFLGRMSREMATLKFASSCAEVLLRRKK